MNNKVKFNCVNLKEEYKYSSGIYKIYHELFPTKLYIGSSARVSKSSGFVRRWGRHYTDLSKNKHGNKKLQNLVNKYGISGLCFEIVEVIQDNNIIIEREQYWIDTLKPYYNICKKAGSSFGRKTSLENIIKRSRPIEQYSLSGKFLSYFFNATEASKKTGIKVSLIRQSCNNQIKKVSQAGGFQWKYKDSCIPIEVYAKGTSHKVACYTKDGNLYKVYSSLLEASKSLNIPCGNISKNITDPRSGVCYGYVFKRIENKAPTTVKVKNHHKNQYKVVITDIITNVSIECKSFNEAISKTEICKNTLSKMVKDGCSEKIHKKKYKIHIMPYE